MIQKYVSEINDAAVALQCESVKTLRMLDEMNAKRQDGYNRISAILDEICKSLDEIGGRKS